MSNIKILSIYEVLERGIEFSGDVCYSGEWGQQVYNRPIEDGGSPITGLVFEKRSNCGLVYYCYYKNGIPDGPSVMFYKSGEPKSYDDMVKGVRHGKSIHWYENGNVKSVAECKYGVEISFKKMDENGQVIEEKNKLTEFERALIEKYENVENKQGLE